jgi:hypothetical protein
MKANKTLQRIKANPRVADAWFEEDNGYWVSLKPGFKWADFDTHAVHESTITQLVRSMREVVPCSCVDCRK